MERLKGYWAVFKKTVAAKIIKDVTNGFIDDNVMLYAASIAFYAIFSLPAVLILVVFVGSVFYGEKAMQGQLYDQIAIHVGPNIALQIENILKNVKISDAGTIAKTIGVATLLFSATTVFVNIQLALNEIWGVRAKPKKGWLKLIVDRLFSFAVVGSLGLILLASLLVDTILTVSERFLVRFFSDYTVYLLQMASFVLLIALLTTVFTIVFKVLPDAKVRWRDVWVGALVTTILFVLGKELIGLYLRSSTLSSAYGAAGSLVLLLIWIYYSSVIFLLGAVFTKIYSQLVGRAIRPKKNAVRVIKKEVEREEKPGTRVAKT
ncbi:MAG: YihY/virulence factor BrkB family protein [Tunicatimonas sp.]